MSPREFKDAVRNMRYWQKKNKEDPSSIGLVRQRELEQEIDNYLESH
jgi:hypothetical protein